MKDLSQLNNKRALSNIIAYVLLIGITISLSVLVFNWLRFYVGDSEEIQCPSGVSLIIDDYSCFKGDAGNLSISLKNNGLFTIEGYILRVHNRTTPEPTFGIYTLNDTGTKLIPGGNQTEIYHFEKIGFSDITLIEIQPFKLNGNKILCDSVPTQRINCK
tara:strand:- start:821 stop:1300 length:480 start_codon:yes stop_codon:yes gene_type:complete